MTELSNWALLVTAVMVILTTIVKVAGVFSRTSSGRRSQDSSERGCSPVPNESSSSSSSSSSSLFFESLRPIPNTSPAIAFSSSLSSDPITPIPNISSSAIASSSSSAGSRKYDVFLSFRGEDTRKTFVDHLYCALVERTICTYKDDETLDRGDAIGPSLLKAIQESHIALVVFSKNYADSSWCLDELAYIMKCKEERAQIVIPIFYDVDPSHVRKQKGQFGKAFAKHDNNDKVESWKKALVDASNIAGWEPKHVANGHEAKCIKEIVGSVLDKLPSFNSVVDDEKLVGMGTRLQDLESQLEIGGSGGVRMVGIWGLGGGGKTTLATCLFMKISANFDGCCFVGNIREESSQHNGLKSLQERILSKVLKTQVDVGSVHIGQHMIKSRLCSRNVLIVLDDVDDVGQLEALAGSHDWFGDGSRIIITTRDQHLLTTHRVDEVYPVSLLSDEEAIRLFRKHAYQQNNPVQDYDELSLRVISYVKGLPLALKILGSFFYGKDKNEWISALEKLKDIPNTKVVEQLKISYNGLDRNERDLFLDIACFFRGKSKEEAMKILDACGFHPRIGVKVLIQKSLITISSDGKFDMHDLVQEMGHHIVRGEHPNNPGKHSRLWRKEDIEDICSTNATTTTTTTENHEIEAIQYYISYEGVAQGFMRLVSNLKNLRFLYVSRSYWRSCDEGPTFLSNELKYIELYRYPATASLLPESFQPRKLVVLKLQGSLQKELWKGRKYMPCLKELEIIDAKALVKTPDIGGLSCLQKLIIEECESLEEIHPSIGSHSSLVYIYVRRCPKLTRFPTIVRMEKLEILKLSGCIALVEFPKIEANMDRLENLDLEYVGIQVLPSSIGIYCTNLISLRLVGCWNLKTIKGNFHALKRLQKFESYYATKHEKLPKDLFDVKCCLQELVLNLSYGDLNTFSPSPPHLPRLLRKLNLSWCELKDGDIPREIGELSCLKELHLKFNHFSRLDISLSKLTQLKLLSLDGCEMLVELPELPSNLTILQANGCKSLEAIGDNICSNCKWLCQVSVGSGSGNLVGGKRLLESMLQGKTIENHHCMSLELKGSEIPRGFEPRLFSGIKCRLQLPENWLDEYTGFLFCSASKSFYFREFQEIRMRHEKEQQQQQVFWEEESIIGYNKNDNFKTWVGYVSFESLRHTAWWNQASTAVDFSTHEEESVDYSFLNRLVGGFGVGLVPKRNQSGVSMEETTTYSSSQISGDYTCQFEIHHDSRSLLVCRFKTLVKSTLVW